MHEGWQVWLFASKRLVYKLLYFEIPCNRTETVTMPTSKKRKWTEFTEMMKEWMNELITSKHTKHFSIGADWHIVFWKWQPPRVCDLLLKVSCDSCKHPQDVAFFQKHRHLGPSEICGYFTELVSRKRTPSLISCGVAKFFSTRLFVQYLMRVSIHKCRWCVEGKEVIV